MAPDQRLHLGEWMAALQISVDELATKMGVDPVTVVRWRNHTRNPNAPKLQALAAAMGIEPADLWQMPQHEIVGTQKRATALRISPDTPIGEDEGIRRSLEEIEGQNPTAAEAIRAVMHKMPRAEIWELTTDLMEGAGYFRGDWVVVAVGAMPRPRDVVQAELHTTASYIKHLFRMIVPPRLLPVMRASWPPGIREEVIDDKRIKVRGVVVMRIR